MTHKELAKLLSISPASLSLILNKKPGISEATRNRVLTQIEGMGLSYLLKSAPTAPSSSICFLIFKRNGCILDQHPFFLLIMESLEQQAKLSGYNLTICTVDARNPIEPQIIRVNSMDVQGIVVFATEMQESDLVFLQRIRHPVVFMDNDFELVNVNTVSINNEMGTYQAVSFLVDQGYRRIGYLRCNERISSFSEREQGYIHALRRFGLELNPTDILSARFSEDGSYLDFMKLLSVPHELPRAFVSDDDTLVSGFMRALSEKGIRVPQDISIVGFNDRPSCELFSPPLTTIDVPKNSFGSEAIDSLVQQISRHASTEKRNRFGRALKLRICTQLVKRMSTRQLIPGEGDTIMVR